VFELVDVMVSNRWSDNRLRQHRQRVGKWIAFIRADQIESAIAVDIRRHNTFRPTAHRLRPTAQPAADG